MAENNTIEIITSYNTSANISTTTDYSLHPALEIFNWILFVVTLAVFLYGVISWCVVKKFRNFRNYVLLSAILANVLRFLVTVISYVLSPETLKHPLVRLVYISVFLYCLLSYNYWLLVLCYIFYADFVKVFQRDIRRKYLKSSFFAWVLPLISVLIYFLTFLFYYVTRSKGKITRRHFVVGMLMMLMPIAINFVIYILVLCSLLRTSKVGGSTSTNKSGRFYISLIIFILSNAVLVFTGILQVFQMPQLVMDILGDLAEYINIIALDIYLPAVKTNRNMWREFFDKKSMQKALEMK